MATGCVKFRVIKCQLPPQAALRLGSPWPKSLAATPGVSHYGRSQSLRLAVTRHGPRSRFPSSLSRPESLAGLPSAPATPRGPPSLAAAHRNSRRPASLAISAACRHLPWPDVTRRGRQPVTAASLATATTCRGQCHLPRPGDRAPPLLAAARVSQVTRRDWPRRHPTAIYGGPKSE